MKTGRAIHVPKSEQMKKNYMRYIGTMDYQPTVDERLDFNHTSQSGEDLSTTPTIKKRPLTLSESIKKHFSNNWLVWILAILAAGILYLVSDSKVAFTRFETMLNASNEKIQDSKSSVNDIKQNDRSQDLKIQENRILLNQIKHDVSQNEIKIDKLIDSK